MCCAALQCIKLVLCCANRCGTVYCIPCAVLCCAVLCCVVLCCLLYLDAPFILNCVVSCRTAFRCSIFTATVPIFQQSVWDNTSDIVLPETLPSEALLFLEQSLDGVDELFEIPFD